MTYTPRGARRLEIRSVATRPGRSRSETPTFRNWPIATAPACRSATAATRSTRLMSMPESASSTAAARPANFRGSASEAPGSGPAGRPPGRASRPPGRSPAQPWRDRRPIDGRKTRTERAPWRAGDQGGRARRRHHRRRGSWLAGGAWRRRPDGRRGPAARSWPDWRAWEWPDLAGPEWPGTAGGWDQAIRSERPVGFQEGLVLRVGGLAWPGGASSSGQGALDL